MKKATIQFCHAYLSETTDIALSAVWEAAQSEHGVFVCQSPELLTHAVVQVCHKDRVVWSSTVGLLSMQAVTHRLPMNPENGFYFVTTRVIRTDNLVPNVDSYDVRLLFDGQVYGTSTLYVVRGQEGAAKLVASQPMIDTSNTMKQPLETAHSGQQTFEAPYSGHHAFETPPTTQPVSVNSTAPVMEQPNMDFGRFQQEAFEEAVRVEQPPIVPYQSAPHQPLNIDPMEEEVMLPLKKSTQQPVIDENERAFLNQWNAQVQLHEQAEQHVQTNVVVPTPVPHPEATTAHAHGNTKEQDEGNMYSIEKLLKQEDESELLRQFLTECAPLDHFRLEVSKLEKESGLKRPSLIIEQAEEGYVAVLLAFTQRPLYILNNQSLYHPRSLSLDEFVDRVYAQLYAMFQYDPKVDEPLFTWIITEEYPTGERPHTLHLDRAAAMTQLQTHFPIVLDVKMNEFKMTWTLENAEKVVDFGFDLSLGYNNANEMKEAYVLFTKLFTKRKPNIFVRQSVYADAFITLLKQTWTGHIERESGTIAWSLAKLYHKSN
ncbi:MAG: hypothetical protein ACRC5C_01290 [Bacilli bacterium]